MTLPRFNWDAIKGWIAILTLVAAAIGGSTGLYLRLDRDVHARMTAEQTNYLIDNKISPFIGEVLRRLERIERKQDEAARVERETRPLRRK